MGATGKFIHAKNGTKEETYTIYESAADINNAKCIRTAGGWVALSDTDNGSIARVKMNGMVYWLMPEAGLSKSVNSVSYGGTGGIDNSYSINGTTDADVSLFKEISKFSYTRDSNKNTNTLTFDYTVPLGVTQIRFSCSGEGDYSSGDGNQYDGCGEVTAKVNEVVICNIVLSANAGRIEKTETVTVAAGAVVNITMVAGGSGGTASGECFMNVL